MYCTRKNLSLMDLTSYFYTIDLEYFLYGCSPRLVFVFGLHSFDYRYNLGSLDYSCIQLPFGSFLYISFIFDSNAADCPWKHVYSISSPAEGTTKNLLRKLDSSNIVGNFSDPYISLRYLP